MCIPELGAQIGATSGTAIFLMESVKGPVALMTDLASTLYFFPVIDKTINNTLQDSVIPLIYCGQFHRYSGNFVVWRSHYICGVLPNK